jgi:hypothetical protein
LIFITLGIQNSWTSGELMVFSILKRRTNQTCFMITVLDDLEVNKEKYSLVNAGGKAVLHLIIQGNE